MEIKKRNRPLKLQNMSDAKKVLAKVINQLYRKEIDPITARTMSGLLKNFIYLETLITEKTPEDPYRASKEAKKEHHQAILEYFPEYKRYDDIPKEN